MHVMHAVDLIYDVGHNPRLRLLGISTVAGNQTVDKVTINALGVTDAAGLQRISMFADAHVCFAACKACC